MAACTSAVDYYAQPKPLYYAVARAYEPLHVSAKFKSLSWKDEPVFELELWASNAYGDTFDASTLEIKLISDETADDLQKTERKASPDVSHSRVVVAGDTLPGRCKSVNNSESG